jgi:tRNA threonylcarbamoyladenosine biosynthesis protein TsaB
MNVLAFDTCLGAVSAAVRRRGPDGDVLREAFELRSAGHAERLMPMIAEVMDGSGLDFADLDRIAVTLGPGGFTGVRVGIAAARALALAAGIPVVGTTSLAVMAHGAKELLGEAAAGRRLVVAVDAHRGALYVQGFGPGAAEVGPALLLTPRQAAEWVGRDAAIMVGSAAAGLAALATEAGGAAEHGLPDLQPHARGLAALASGLMPGVPVKPLYLRAPDVRPQDAATLGRAHPRAHP